MMAIIVSRAKNLVESLLLLLFLPHRAVRRLGDYPAVWPACCVAVISYIPVAIRVTSKERWSANAAYLTGILCCIVCNVVAYAIIAGVPWPRRARPICVRPFVAASLYTTCFVVGWAIVEPPMLFSLGDATFFWPFAGDVVREARKFGSLAFLACSLIYYWWWLILTVFVGVSVPRRGWLFVVAPPMSTFVATRAAYWAYNLLDF